MAIDTVGGATDQMLEVVLDGVIVGANEVAGEIDAEAPRPIILEKQIRLELIE